jgi:lactoylglutathione lyase
LLRRPATAPCAILGRMADEAFPILSVRDLAQTVRFYEQLGFEQTYRFPPDGEPGFVTLQRGASQLGIGAGADEQDRVAYWVYVDDVDRTLDVLRAAGTVVVGEPVDQPWGERVAQVRDPAGTLVHLGSST